LNTVSINKEIPRETPCVAGTVNLIKKLILFPKMNDVLHISDTVLVSLTSK